MSLRNSKLNEITDILLRDKTSGNPFAGGSDGGALENWYIDQGKLVRVPFMPPFHTSASGNAVWAMKEFNFTRDGAAEQQLLIFKSNGKVYRRRGGEEVQIFPPPDSTGATSSFTTGYPASASSGSFGAPLAPWSNASNATGIPDSSYATTSAITLPTAPYSQTDFLYLTNISLAPTLNPIGIQIQVSLDVDLVSGAADFQVYAALQYSGSAIGISKLSPVQTSTSPLTLTFGSEADVWGASLSNSIISSSTFGVGIIIVKVSDSGVGSITPKVDGVLFNAYGSAVATTGFNLLVRKPAIAQINNRLHVSDGEQYLIWDGWNWFNGGLAAPTGFSSSSTSVAGADGTLTAAATYAIAISAVHIRTNNGVDVRVHESNRTALASETPAATNHITVSTSGVTFPARATHWSVYLETPAASGVLRRVTTLPLTTTSYDILAEPAATAATAPTRNDPVLPTRILTQWKNRIAQRGEANQDRFKFSAFGEVNGLLNGAGEECVPGLLGTSTLSDLSNDWQIPDGGQPMQCAVYHGEVLWVFTDRNGFIIQGEGALLDDTGLRDFLPQKAASFGAAGHTAALSTPFGLAVMSHEHKLWLLRAVGGEPIDIGHDIQDRLDDLTEQRLNEIEMVYWSGEGWDWLLLPLTDRIEVFDFALGTDKSPAGGWFSIIPPSPPTAFTVYHPDKKFLLVGCEDGSVHQIGTLCQPSHLGLSCVLGNTYLSATVQDSPDALARTGPLRDDQGRWMEHKYVQIFHRGHTDETSINVTNPTVNAYFDPINPADPSSPVAQTLATVSGSNERRAWLKPSSTASAAGALAKNMHLEIECTTTDTDTTTDSASRPTLINNEILKIGIASVPKENMTL